MWYDELSNKHGDTYYQGKRYILLDNAYSDCQQDNFFYEALAVCVDDEPDADGLCPCYRVIWRPLPEFLAYRDECMELGVYADEGSACDWDNADIVQEVGEYSPEQNRIS